MSSKPRYEWPLTGALLLVAIASANAIANDLVWDDMYVIGQGTVIYDVRNVPDVFAHRTMYASSAGTSLSEEGAQTYRPVTLVTFFWDAALSGRLPISYHVTNLLVHLMVVLLVFQLARRLSSEAHGGYAAFAAAWFGLSPLPAEAHVWINGRSDLFCTLFVVAAVQFWRSARDASARGPRVRYDLAAAVCFLLALLSKEPALFVVPALFFWPSDAGVALRTRALRLSGFFAAVLVYFVMRSVALSGVHAVSATSQLGVALVRAPTLLLDGLTQLLVPTRVTVRALSADYDALGTFGLLALAVIALCLATFVFLRRKQEPLVVFCVVWFACTLAPAAFVTTTLWPGFGRFLYLPAAGLAPLVGSLAARALTHPRIAALARSRALLSGALGLYLVILGVRQHLWTYDWRDEDTLYRSWIAAEPDRPHGYAWLGITYLERNRTRDAIPLLERAHALAPREQRFTMALAAALVVVGERERARQVLGDSLREGGGNPGLSAIHAITSLPAHPDAAARELVTCIENEPEAGPCIEAMRNLDRVDPGFRAAVQRLRPHGLRRGASKAR